ncbi:hypothetical protein Ddye_020351 [Dipteronia dyeriana]|uniref:Protein TIFY n=1 Tax=Dipteronia dyeriana TaxID=168575 RepID=A0AAD9U0C8_9ROSI|nr:hypothetical protein Ddye_020351 [Dipteronia dyeriana]
METGFRSVEEEEKPKVGEKEEKEEKMKLEVGGGNDAVKVSADDGSVGGLDFSGNKLSITTNNTARSMAVPTSRINATNFSPSQLTIFYGGKVCVFDALPAEKVHEILLLATAAAASNSGDTKSIGTNCPASSPVLTRSPSLQSTGSALPSPRAQPYPIQRNSFCKLQAELPMARRHSLQRFFEKRRDRLVSKNPYAPHSGIKMPENTKASLIAEASADSGYCQTPIHGEELPSKTATDVA